MPGCSAVNCTNQSSKFRVFRFPSNPVRNAKWILNMRRSNWTPTPSARLCETHFEESQFEQNRKDGWKKLKQDAVPTLFNIPNPPPMIDPPQRQSVYKNPLDQERWLTAAMGKIRKGRKSQKKLFFCEKHFAESDIIRSFEVVISDAQVEKFERDVVKLKTTAIPSIFPNDQVLEPTVVVQEESVDEEIKTPECVTVPSIKKELFKEEDEECDPLQRVNVPLKNGESFEEEESKKSESSRSASDSWVIPVRNQEDSVLEPLISIKEEILEEELQPPECVMVPSIKQELFEEEYEEYEEDPLKLTYGLKG